ncbi:TIGR01777 family oxidoreductase [Pontiella sp.]|uniref:TIGR01777 family oxidoreductase n=1 Tax=Pontiella sp. TaxID=2837462 RepID=UPI0035623EEF
MKIMISGSHGLVGSALHRYFSQQGSEVLQLGRDLSETLDFSNVDAVIHLAGENISKGRWTKSKKQRIRESRVDGTSSLAAQLAAASVKPKVFVSASAIGYYGNRGDEKLNEDSKAGRGFLSEVCQQWEAAAEPTIEVGLRTVFLRTGIVLSDQGGALEKMLRPFKFGVGGIIGNGKQYMSWISISDMVRIIDFLIRHENLIGAFNVVSPEPVTNHKFTKALGNVLKRPTILPLPAVAARLIFGEMAEALLLSSARVFPKRLMEAGYEFKHADLESALEDILK